MASQQRDTVASARGRVGGAAANLALAVGSLAFFLVAFELLLRAFAPWLALEEGRDVALVNPNDPKREQVALSPAAAEQLADSVVFHIRSNHLTAPDPELLFRVRPNPEGGPVFGYSGINAQGFRGRSLERVDGRMRVVLVGDSCGFGFGIRDPSLTIDALLEAELNREGEDSVVYNLSQPGYSSAQARRLLERWLPVLEPDVVVLYLGWNDLWAARGLDDEALLGALRWTHTGPLRLVTGSHIWIALRAAVREILRPEPGELPVLGGEGRRVSASDAVANHRAMLDAARARGAAVLVIMPPFYEGEDRTLGAMQGYTEAVHAALAAEVTFVSLEPMRRGTARARRFFQADGYHPNPRGSRLIAGELAARIRELDRS